MKREELVNQDFEYFTVEFSPAEGGKEIIDLRDDTVAIIGSRVVQFNQLDVFAKSESDYHSVYLEKQTILDLAEYIKNN